MARNIAGYISNLGKSVAYSAVDKIKEMSPTTAEFASTNAELFKVMYTGIRDYKGTYTRGLQTIKKSKIYEAADLGMKSIFEDIKTGKFYNKEREDQIASKIMGFGSDSDSFGSFDMNDDFDMDFNDDDDFGSFDGVTQGDKVVAGSIIESSKNNAEMISMSVAKSAQHITETQKASTHLLYTQNLQAYNLFNSNLSAMNSNLSNMVSFSNEAIKGHIKDSNLFFTNATKLMQDQTALLREIVGMMKGDRAEQEKEKKKRTTFSDITGAQGTPNISEYFNVIKKNISDQMGAAGSLNSMFGEDSNALLSFVASPLKKIPDLFVNKLVPKAVEKAFGEFDKSLSGFFGSLISKFNTMAKDEDNFITSTIGKIFGIRNSVKSSIETANYNKGKVDWDGKSRKALIEVIPTQLAKIVSLLSGKPEKVYDYDKGTFVDSSEIKNMLKNMRTSNARRATSDMRETFEKYMNSLSFSSLDEKESLQKDIDKFFEYMYSSGEMFNMFGKNSKDEYLKYGIDSKSYAIIKAMFKNADKHLQHSINKNILEQRDKENAEMISLEEKADSIIQHIFNNSNLGEFYDEKKKNNGILNKGGLLDSLDNRGKNVFFYLQNIYKELSFIRRFGGFGSGGNDNERLAVETAYGDYVINEGHSLDEIVISDSSEKSQATKDREERERKRQAFLRKEKKRREKNDSLIDISKIDNEKEIENLLSSNIKLIKLQEELEEKDTKKKSLIDRLLEAENVSGKFEVVIDNLNRLSKKPMDFIVNTLNKVDQRMYEVIYGKEGKNGDIKGFMDVMILKLKSTFGKFNLWLDEEILKPLKNKLNIESFSDIGKKFLGAFGIDTEELRQKISDAFTGENSIVSSIKESIKGTFKNAFGTVKQSLKDVYGPLFKKAKDTFGSSNKFKDLDDVAENFEGANGLSEIDWANASEEQLLNEWYRQQSLNNTIKVDKFRNYPVDNKHYESFDYDESLNSLSPESRLKHLGLTMDDSIAYQMQISNQLQSKKNRLMTMKNKLKANPSDNKLKAKISALEKEISNEEKILKRDYKSEYKNLKLDIETRDYFRDTYTEELTKRFALRKPEDRDLVREILSKAIPDSEKLGDIDDYTNITLGDLLNHAEGNDKFKKVINRFNTKQDLHSYTIEDLILGRTQKSTEELKKDGKYYAENYPGLVGNISNKNPMFNSIFDKVVEGLDYLKSMKESLIEIVQSINPRSKNTKGFKKPSIANNISTPFSANPLVREEEVAIDSFASELGNIISGSIANYMRGNTKKYASGGFIEEAQVATIGRGELVISKEDTENLFSILHNLMDNVSKQEKSKLASMAYNNKSLKELSKKYGNLNIEDIASLDKDLYNKYGNLSYTEKDNLDVVLARVLAQYKEDDNTEVDKKGRPIDPVKRAAFEEAKPYIQKVGDEFVKGTRVVRNALFGTGIEEDNEAFGEFIDDTIHNISKYAPDAIGSGLLGAGVSLITGAFGGPLLGAAVGAGISLTKNSEKAQNWIFGEQDEEGNRKGGVVSKKFMDTVNNYLPDLKKYGIAGAATGFLPLLPFGPIGGLLLGSGFAFAKRNQAVQDFFFGEDDGLFKPETKNKIKKMLPRLGLSVGASLLYGPFGFMGNAIMGSSLGLLSTTNTFQQLILGNKDQKGKYQGGLLPTLRDTIVLPMKDYIKNLGKRIGGFLKKDIFGPLKSAFAPIKKSVEVLLKGMFGGIGNFLNKMFEKSFGVPLNKLFEEVTKKFTTAMGQVFKPLAWLGKTFAKTAISLPFKLIGAGGNSLRKMNIRSGNADYMTAKERMQFRKDKNIYTMGLFGEDKFYKTDRILADMEDESVDNLSETLRNIRNKEKDNKKNRKASARDIASDILPYFKYTESKNIMRRIRDGKIDEVTDYIKANNKISDEEKESLIESLQSKYDTFQKREKKRLYDIENKDEVLKKLQAKGIDVNEDNIDKYIKMLEKETRARKNQASKNTEEKKEREKTTEEKQLEATQENHKEITGFLGKILNAITGKNNSSESTAESEAAVTQEQEVQDGSGISKKIINAKSKKLRMKPGVVQKIDDDGTVRHYVYNEYGELVPDKSHPETIKELKQEREDEENRNTIYERLGKVLQDTKEEVTDLGSEAKGKGLEFISGISTLAKGLFKGGSALLSIGGIIATGFLTFMKGQDGQRLIVPVVKSVGSLLMDTIKTLLPKQLKKLLGIDEDYGEDGLIDNVADAAGYDGASGLGSEILNSSTRAIVTGKGLKGSKFLKKLTKSSLSGGLFKRTYKLANPLTFVKESTKFAGRTVGRGINSAAKLANKLYDKVGISKVKDFILQKTGITKVTQTAATALDNANILQPMFKSFQNFLENFFNHKLVVGRLGKDRAEKISSELIPKIMKEITERAAKGGSKIAAKIIGGVSTGFIFNVIWAAADFVSGFNDCKDILGIVQEPTFAMKVGTGLVNALGGLTFVSSLIPTKSLVNFVMDIVLPILGKEDSDIQKMREESNKILEEYKAKTGKDISVEEYNDQYGKKGFISKIVDGTKKTWNNLKDWFNSARKEMTTTPDGVNLDDLDLYETIKNNSYVYSGKGKSSNKVYTGKGNSISNKLYTGKGKSSPGKVYTGKGASQEDIKYMELNSPIKKKVSAKDINKWVNPIVGKDGPFYNIGDKAMEAYEKTGLDPRYLVAHAAWESAWGKSAIAREKNNYFGIQAYNASPGESAKTFSSGLEGFVEGAQWIKDHYTDVGQNTIYSMLYGGKAYAQYDDGTPNKDWMNGISNIMYNSDTINSGTTNKDAKWNGTSVSDSGSSSNTATSVSNEEATGGSIFNAFTDLGTALSNDFNRIFGFSNDSEDSDNNSSSDSGSTSLSGSEFSGGLYNEGDYASRAGNYTLKKLNDFTYFSQSENPWANYIYRPSGGGMFSDPTVRERGCGTTSAAMVIRQLTGNKDVDPASMADLSTDSGTSVEAGTAHSFFNIAGQKYGLNVSQTPITPSVLSTVTKDNPMIINGTGGPGGRFAAPFYGGHFVVGVKGTKDTITINDPFSQSTSKTYKMSEIAPYMEQGWRFNKGGGKGGPSAYEQMEEKYKSYGKGPSMNLPRSTNNTSQNTTSNSNKYEKILLSIVEILIKISDNSNYLSKIVEILSNTLGVNISEETKQSIQSNSSGAKQSIVNVIKQSVSESNPDNEYLLNLLDSIATQ